MTAPPRPVDRSQEAHYRPQLDGMRAVAVYLVVAFHAGISAFSGGFIGVDVFFVLSGYLVTQLLMRDFRAAGRIDFRRFYSRRFRRLLPAAFVALLVTAAVYAAVAAPADVLNAVGGFRPRSSTSPTGTSSASRTTTSRRTSIPTPSCTSGRWRSRSSSTCAGRSCSRPRSWWHAVPAIGSGRCVRLDRRRGVRRVADRRARTCRRST